MPEVLKIAIIPDITIRDHKGNVVCVVEIGYTRPEKLRAYRKLKIPDVRWYSKSGELVTEWDIVQQIVHVKYKPPIQERFYLLVVEGIWRCLECFEEIAKDLSCNCPEDSDCVCHKELDYVHLNDEIYSLASDEATAITISYVWISNFWKGVALNYCEECCQKAIEYTGSFEPEGLFELCDWKSFAHFLREANIQRMERNESSSRHPEIPLEEMFKVPSCSFDDVERFIKEDFDESIELQYESMKRMEGWESVPNSI